MRTLRRTTISLYAPATIRVMFRERMQESPTPTAAKHPRGLYVLFFTEMWERFGYYLLAGILPLYLRDTMKGGKGMDNAHAADIAGSYVALVYLTPFIGGLIADRYLGYRKAIIFGGSLMAIGYFMLAIPGSNALMFASLGTIIVGNGFFKPNISTLLGNVYNAEELRARKDSAYNIFYMGINIGAFICNFVAAILRNHYGWGWAFAAAGVGMVISIISFLAGMKTVAHADVIKPMREDDLPISKIVGFVFVPALVAGAIGWVLPHAIFGATCSRRRRMTPSSSPASRSPSSTSRCGGAPKGSTAARRHAAHHLRGLDPLLEHLQPEHHGADVLGRQLHAPRGADELQPVLKPFDLAQTADTTPQGGAGPRRSLPHAAPPRRHGRHGEGARSLLPQSAEEPMAAAGRESEPDLDGDLPVGESVLDHRADAADRLASSAGCASAAKSRRRRRRSAWASSSAVCRRS